MFQYLIPVTDGAQLIAVVSTDGGSSYDTTSGNYHSNGTIDRAGYLLLEAIGSAANENGVAGTFHLYGPHRTNYTYAKYDIVMVRNNGNVGEGDTPTNGLGQQHLVAADVDAIKFLFTSGNIESGEIVMYGIANGT